jgi:hypothetical protein
MVKAAETIEPELFRMLYPRIYNDIGAFHSPKVVAAYLTDAVASSRGKPVGMLPQAHRLILPSIAQLIKHKMPYMFIAPDLLEAIKRTDFPDVIDWIKLALPYEHGLFMLPKGALVHPEDGEAVCIFYGRTGPGDWPPPCKGIPILTIENHCFSFIVLCPKNAMWFDGNLTDIKPTVVKLNNLFYALGDDYGEGPHLPCPTALDHHLNAVDSRFLEDASTILFGTLLAMNARPALNTPAKLEKRIQRANEAPKEFWSPNVIGKHYRLPRATAGEGTHASPRIHWRRGHFREQAHGLQRSLRKTIWLEPQLVNAKEKRG